MERQGFDPNIYTLDNYSKAVGIDLIGIELNEHVIRDVLPDESSPDWNGSHFPIHGSIDKFFGNPRTSEETKHGFLYYNKGCDFLKDPMKWSIVKADVSVCPEVVLYSDNNRLFCERGYSDCRFDITNSLNQHHSKSNKYTIQQPWQHLNMLRALKKYTFKHSFFDDIIGVFINLNHNEGHRIYHSHSGCINLSDISPSTPKTIKKELAIKLAKALKEINLNNIFYYNCQPSNIGYDIKNNKMIFHPHNDICFNPGFESVSDISAVLYTHDWIDNMAGFCKHFLGINSNTKHFNNLIEQINDEFDNLNSGDMYQMGSCWQERKKVFYK